MPIFKRGVKILLYGDIHGVYRSENLIKLLLDQGYLISIINPDFYLRGKLQQSSSHNLLRKAFSRFYFIDLLIKAWLSDVIYVLPLNNKLIHSALWVSRIFKNKLIFEMYISVYDTYVRDKQEVEEDSKAAKALYRQDILALTCSDYLINISNYELDYWQQVLGVKAPAGKSFLAPLFTETSLVRQRSFMEDGMLRLCWWGTFLPLHGIDKVLAALKILKQKGIPFTCELFGAYGSGYAERFHAYEQRIQSDSELNQQVTLRKDLKFSDQSLPEYLVKHCDLAFGVFGDTEKARSVVPNKLIEALSLGVPTLTMQSPALSEFFDPSVDFWVCEATPEAIAHQVIDICHGTAYPVNWDNTRQKVLETFNVSKYKEVVLNILTEIEHQLQSS